MRPRRLAVATGAIIAAALAGAGTGARATTLPSTTCGAAFVFGGVRYTEAFEAPGALAPGRALRGTEPACEVRGRNAHAARTASAATLRGVPASVALLAKAGAGDGGGTRVVMPNTRTRLVSFPVLTAHPLHALYRTSARLEAAKRCPVETFTGRIRDLGGDSLTLWGHLVVLQPSTRLTGRSVDGVPRLARNDEVRVSAHVCPRSSTELARTVTLLP